MATDAVDRVDDAEQAEASAQAAPSLVLDLSLNYDGSIGPLDNPPNASVLLTDSTASVVLPAASASVTPAAFGSTALLTATAPAPVSVMSGDAGTAVWSASIGGVLTQIASQPVVLQPQAAGVPVPPGGSVPGQGGVLPAPYGLATGYSSGDSPTASGFDLLSALAQNGVAGALAGIGAGTITGGTAGTAAGLMLPISAWAGVLPASGTRTGFAAGTAAAASLPIPAASAFTVYAVPVAQSLADGTPYDTAESGLAEFAVSADGSVPDGGLALLTGTSSGSAITGATDVRVLIGAAVQTEIAALAARAGADEARITALEQAGQGGPTAAIVVFWGALARSQADPTLLAAYIAAQIPTPPPAPTPAPLVVDIECVNTLKTIGMIADLGWAAQQAGQITNAALVASLSTAVDVYFYDPRIHGLDPTRVDLVNSTPGIVNVQTGWIG